MVAASLVVDEVEGEDQNIRAYSCQITEEDCVANGGNNESSVTHSAASASASLETTTPSPVPTRSVRTVSSIATSASASTHNSEAQSQQQQQQQEQQQSTPASEEAECATANTPSSPSITAIATPEPSHRWQPSSQQQHDSSVTCPPEVEHLSSPAPSTMAIAVATPQQPHETPRRVCPLELEHLSSPAPSMVVTDEQLQQTPSESFYGSWRTTLCSCWWDSDVICSSLPWMSCCCNAILIGQLMTRLRLNWCGEEDPEAAVRTFGIVASITFCYILLCAIGVGMFVAPFFMIWLWFLATKIRSLIRQRYGISAPYGACEDFCCSVWCLCCSTIQMARHTHDEKRYPYECFSPTGLPTYAPDIPPSSCRMESEGRG